MSVKQSELSAPFVRIGIGWTIVETVLLYISEGSLNDNVLRPIPRLQIHEEVHAVCKSGKIKAGDGTG